MTEDLLKKLKKQGSIQLLKKLESGVDSKTKRAIEEILNQRGVIIPKAKAKQYEQARVKGPRRKLELDSDLKETKDKFKEDVGTKVRFKPNRYDFEVEGVIVGVGINRRNNTFFYFIKSEDKRLKKEVHAKRVNKITAIDFNEN